MADLDLEKFIQLHQSQLELSNVPKQYWSTIHEKLKNTTFDAGEVFTLLQVEYEGERGDYDSPWELQVKAENELEVANPKHLYLVDHAWTFRIENARKQLRGSDSLRTRMASIIGLDPATDTEELSEQIFEELWKYCDCYWTQDGENAEDRIAVWYVLDEVGSAIRHSETPNFRVVPILYIPEQIIYSLIFPLKDVSSGEIILRNFVDRPTDKEMHKALLLPWMYTSFLETIFVHVEPDPDYFLSGHVQESLPILCALPNQQRFKDKYKVFAEYTFVHKYLTDAAFELVDDEEEADILWYTRHFKDFEGLCQTPDKFVNQFPFEYVLTIKDLLCIIARRKADKNRDVWDLRSSPTWLPVTYNLVTELTKFVSYYQHREEKGFDNHWIIKPFNLARGLDTHITKSLNHIVRLPATGPKIAQKYIANPVLFHRPECDGKVKFDIRYVVLLKSVKPLEAYAYKQFFLRFANQPFQLRDFDQYTKHFTVMNYTGDDKDLKHMLCTDFKMQWAQQYPDVSWESVEGSIFQMLREALECASMECPPCGISESPQSRALYAADIMLEWTEDATVQPKLLEINWTPDCKRACEYYPDFFNDIFKLLFLDVDNSEVFLCL